MKTVQVYDRHFTFGYRNFNLTLLQRLKLKLFARVKIFTAKKEGWRTELDFYIGKCSLHGLFLEYPHGNYDILTCPRCKEEGEHRQKQL